MPAVNPTSLQPPSRRPGFSAGVGWLLAGRTAILAIMLMSISVSAAVFANWTEGPAQALYLPIAVIFAFYGASALWVRIFGAGKHFVHVQLGCDGLIITWIIYLTGGAVSPFLFLYLPHIMAASMLMSRRAAYTVATIDLGAYLALVLALTSGLLQPVSELSTTLPLAGLVSQLIGLILAMVLVTLASSFLVGKLRASTTLVEQSRKDLLEISARQQSLIDGLPDGVLTLDERGRITGVNQAALTLFGTVEDEIRGQELERLLAKLDPDFKTSFPAELPQSGEIELASVRAGEPRKLVFERATIPGEGSRTSLYCFRDVTELKALEGRLELQERMARLLATDYAPQGGERTELAHFIGESPVMQKVFKLIRRVAPSDATVLIDGESGTGKELVARAIHLGGPRATGPFIPVNCGAIPENLIESELFGHKKGSFTGADSDHTGLFRQAEGGTMFLDEIGELPLQMQSKLLRALQEKTVRPVGGDRDQPINVRIIAATNKNLRKEIETGGFREDLFYRLNVIHIMLPPLRERKDDIPLLVNSILKRLRRDEPLPVVTPGAMQLLVNYRYPGNVRELENILERALVLGGDAILPEHLPEALALSGPSSARSAETEIIIDESLVFPVKLDDLLASMERRYLEAALLQTNGAKKKAAALLGINFRSFRYRLQKFGLRDDEENEVEQ